MNRLMQRTAVACVILFVGAAARTDEAEVQKLHGKWIVEDFQYNGAPVERLKDAIREFKAGKYTLTPKAGDAIEGNLILDATKQPKTIDLDVNGRVLKGIYELEGDLLKMCYNLNDEVRPTEFASKPDSGLIVVVHRREK